MNKKYDYIGKWFKQTRINPATNKKEIRFSRILVQPSGKIVRELRRLKK